MAAIIFSIFIILLIVTIVMIGYKPPANLDDYNDLGPIEDDEEYLTPIKDDDGN